MLELGTTSLECFIALLSNILDAFVVSAGFLNEMIWVSSCFGESKSNSEYGCILVVIIGLVLKSTTKFIDFLIKQSNLTNGEGLDLTEPLNFF